MHGVVGIQVHDCTTCFKEKEGSMIVAVFKHT